MSVVKCQSLLPENIEAQQFTTLDDYLRILAWMREAGCTFARANEVWYTTPIMYFQSWYGTQVARPGDWVCHHGDRFFVVEGMFFRKVYHIAK